MAFVRFGSFTSIAGFGLRPEKFVLCAIDHVALAFALTGWMFCLKMHDDCDRELFVSRERKRGGSAIKVEQRC